MKFFLISDNNDTLTGMRLAGINGIVVHTTEEAVHAVDEALKNKEIGILLISEKLSVNISGKIGALKEKAPFPLIVEVPDRHGSIKDENYILNYVKESVGIKI